MELFDKKFVHFMWDDELEGKEVFVADNINTLIECVEKSTATYKVHWSGNIGMPIERDDLARYHFAYYDPNFQVKKAFNEGKKVQVHDPDTDDWVDCDEPLWLAACKYREKPEEEKWVAYIQRNDGRCECRLVFCAEGRWEYVQDCFGAKTKLFVGAQDEVSEWCKSRQNLTETIKAWEDGKTIEFFNPIDGIWSVAIKPIWEPDLKYRVKPECPCDVGIDSKACVGCPQSEDGKKQWRPYINSAEMVTDFIARFKVKCPPYVKPLIWTKHKRDANSGHLITDFFHGAGVRVCGGFFSFEALLYEYTYLDGSPCGMETE